ncbi:unnamed protein product [Soboliphyme baturini]|uniref:UPAR/Ly6 domain-containing protein n=1 Tax=Soboliphyme baturini TaxID=241478 RepID=A0A183IHQ7_9BILA|nr:unnamed protein product [Soboliphyme baturini]
MHIFNYLGLQTRCYQCFGSKDRFCNGRTCKHGVFGCIKSVMYTGGLDPSGLQRSNSDNEALAYKGCVILPFHLTCICNTDYCNSAVKPNTAAIWIKFVVIFLLQWMF